MVSKNKEGGFKRFCYGGRFVEVLADATIVWPLIVKAVQERLKNV